MLRVLINAYAVCPGMGSEPGMGWNWISSLAKYCELFIITESEFHGEIETELALAKAEGTGRYITRQQAENMNFHYNTIGGCKGTTAAKIRKMCWNQGDWRFYPYYQRWQRETYEIAKELVEREKIDILHQLNMIGFREPGYLWKIQHIPLVWGPVGGIKQFPLSYLDGAGIGMRLFLRIKNAINVLQLKYDHRVSKALNRAALLISSIPDSYQALRKYHRVNPVVIPETGCYMPKMLRGEDMERFSSRMLQVVWVGKFDFRKRLDIALRALAKANAKGSMQMKVYGEGNERQTAEYRRLVSELGLDATVEMMGNCPNEEIHDAMNKAGIFLFTSISEDTSTVVLEAIQNGLPVICFDTCGMSAVVNEKVGVKIPLSNPKQSVEDFAHVLSDLQANRWKLAEMSRHCRQRAEELSWDNKAQKVVKLYEKLVVTKEQT